MTRLPSPGIPIPPPAPEVVAASPDDWMAELGALLTELESPAPSGPSLPQTPEEATDDQLAKRRLGIAGSLFAALQCKHAATASHSIRVALTCSAWATRLDFDQRQREQLEIAALLHDIGIVGTPDHVLLKPTRLDSDEAAIMARARAMSVEILRRSCTSPEILGIVENIAAWYDGSRGRDRARVPCRGEQIPLAARMIAVAEAFDAMTTDRVYRPALSQERAMAELFRCAGSQFDPILVRQFVEMLEGDRGSSASRWPRAGCFRSIRRRPTPIGTSRRPAPAAGPAGRGVALRGQAAGQHVRRRRFRRCAGPHRAVEPRGRAADGHRRREHPPATLASGDPQAVRREEPDRSARPIAPCWRRSAPACNRCGGSRSAGATAAAWPSIATSSR